VVAQISRRKAVLKKVLAGGSITASETTGAAPDSPCPLSAWLRSPIRVAFEPAGSSSGAGAVKQTFVIRGHVIDLMTEEERTKRLQNSCAPWPASLRWLIFLGQSSLANLRLLQLLVISRRRWSLSLSRWLPGLRRAPRRYCPSQ